MIDTMFQEGTDLALDDRVMRPILRPEAPRFSLGRTAAAAPRGLGAGALEVGAFASEVAGAFGQAAERISYSLLPASNENQKAYKEAGRSKAIDWNTTEGEVLRTTARDIMPDAGTAHESEQLVAGLSGFALKGISYTLAAGPMGGAALLGGDAGLTEADRLKAQGVDLTTRTQAGAVAGVIAGASMLVPMTGPSALYRFGVGAGTGAAGVVGQAVAEREILRAAGYDKLADTFDPLDPVGLAVGLVPGALGAVFGKAKPPKPVKPSAGGAAWDEANAATRAQELSPDRLGVLRQELANPATPAAERARLQAQIDAIEAQGAIRGEPDAAPAVRVAQAARAIEDSRPPVLDTLAGRDAHVSAVELAADQIGRGEPVNVVESVMPHIISAVEREANFRAWFGDSKVVDAEGRPLVVYHGTTADFSAFEPGDGRNGAALGSGVMYFTADPKDASGYGRETLADARADGRKIARNYMPGARVLPVYVRLENPLRYTSDMPTGNELVAMAKARGHDGVVYETGQDGAANRFREVVAFRPEQIKSAIGNSGRFDPNSASLTDPMPALAKAVQTLADARQPKEPATRATAAPEAPNREAPPSAGGAGDTPAAPARAGAAGDVQAARVASAADEVAALDPEMLVQLDGMDAPARVGDLLASVKEEAARDLEIGKLVDVAAKCALRT